MMQIAQLVVAALLGALAALAVVAARRPQAPTPRRFGAAGPEPIAFDQDLMVSNTSPVQTVGGSDILMNTLFTAQGYPTYARRIYCQGAGSIGIKRAGDSAFVSYTVPAGQYLDGRIVAVGSTSDGSSAGMAFIAEQ